MHPSFSAVLLVGLVTALPNAYFRSPVRTESSEPLSYVRRDSPIEHDGMSGMSGMAGMSASGTGNPSLVDFLMNSSLSQKLFDTIINFLPKAPLFKQSDKLTTSKKTTAKRTEFWFGPFDIATVTERQKTPNKGLIAMDPGSTSLNMHIKDLPKDITVLDGTLRLLYEDGTPANIGNGIYNHHTGIQNTGKPPTLLVACPGAAPLSATPLSTIVSAAEEGGSYSFVPKSNAESFDGGYYIGPNQGIYLGSEVINNTNETKKVFAVADLNYVPGKGKSDVSSSTMSVSQCEGQIAIRPSGGQKKWSVVSKDLTVQKDGYVFDLRGHLHDGGVSTSLMLNNQTICESKAIYGGAGKESGGWATVSDMTECNKMVPIKKGDIFTVRASYDLELHPAREMHASGGMAEGMGLVRFRFAATENP